MAGGSHDGNGSGPRTRWHVALAVSGNPMKTGRRFQQGDDRVCSPSLPYDISNRQQGNENRLTGMMVIKTMLEAFGSFAVRRTQQEVRRQEIGAMLLRYLERYWLALVLRQSARQVARTDFLSERSALAGSCFFMRREGGDFYEGVNMSARHRALALVLLASFLVTGCGAVAPTATSVPATATRVALGPTSALLPPSTDGTIPWRSGFSPQIVVLTHRLIGAAQHVVVSALRGDHTCVACRVGTAKADTWILLLEVG
jgi:hypothetical protein